MGLMDDLLDFSLDIGGGEVVGAPLSSSASPKPDVDKTVGGSLPEVAGEELEWFLNKDSFPALDTYVGSMPSELDGVVSFPKQRSPVSVLETGIVGAAADILSSVPVKARSKSCRRRRKRFTDLPIDPCWWFNQQQNNDQTPKLERPRKVVSSGRKCLHCQAEKTPQWRAGPMGPKTLCNACGVRYKSGRLVPEYRPASSPTFSTQLHSNSHRKIMEMRKKQMETG